MARIFVVDDNATIRACLRTALEKGGEWVVVGEAEDGRRALEKWSEVSPEPIGMDFVTPEMNGLEASRQLTKSHPEAPILMVTVDPSQQLAQKARKAGVKGLVPKSDLQSVLHAVEALLKGQTYFKLDWHAGLAWRRRYPVATESKRFVSRRDGIERLLGE